MEGTIHAICELYFTLTTRQYEYDKQTESTKMFRIVKLSSCHRCCSEVKIAMYSSP
jgi:hypothetical protein